MHFKNKNNQAIRILKKYNVLFKKDSKIPFDNRDDLRLFKARQFLFFKTNQMYIRKYIN